MSGADHSRRGFYMLHDGRVRSRCGKGPGNLTGGLSREGHARISLSADGSRVRGALRKNLQTQLFRIKIQEMPLGRFFPVFAGRLEAVLPDRIQSLCELVIAGNQIERSVEQGKHMVIRE